MSNLLNVINLTGILDLIVTTRPTSGARAMSSWHAVI